MEQILTESDQLEREQNWEAALDTVQRAGAAATGGGDATLESHVRERLRDFEFINRLEKIRMQRSAWIGNSFDDGGAVRDYAGAFRDYGVDVEVLPEETSIARLKARPIYAEHDRIALGRDHARDGLKHLGKGGGGGVAAVVEF